MREFILKPGHRRADSLLCVDGKVIGVIGAKPEGHTLRGVETQSAMYTERLPDGIPNHRLPIPFAYESTGVVTQFTNGLNPDPRSREVFGGVLVSGDLELWVFGPSTLRDSRRSLADRQPDGR